MSSAVDETGRSSHAPFFRILAGNGCFRGGRMVESRRERSCFLKACGIGKERLEKRENLFPDPLVYGNGRLEIRKRLRGVSFPMGA